MKKFESVQLPLIRKLCPVDIDELARTPIDFEQMFEGVLEHKRQAEKACGCEIKIAVTE